MNETRTSAGVRKSAIGVREEAGRQLGLAQGVGWLKLSLLRRLLKVALLACVLVLAVEAVSSYVLYRHYSRLHRSFYPAGSATMDLALALKVHGSGRRAPVDLSIDKGPLFRSDPVLGYAMYPGSYHITEKMGGLIHRFSFLVDALGHRVTSYQPSMAARHMYVTGDSAMFGWGLDDEQTIPWLLQTRFPQWNIVNLSVTSYSTVHAMLQLDQISPAVTADDIVVLTYHPVTNDFNVASSAMLYYLSAGFERQLGDVRLLREMSVPFGSLDANDTLAVRQYAVACALDKSTLGTCAHPARTREDAIRVTIRTFDVLMAAHPAHFVVAFLSGDDSDAVIVHLKSKGAVIADLRTHPADPDANDEVPTDGHAGPFWNYGTAERLAAALRSSGLVK